MQREWLLYRNYRNCNCFSCCNSKTTTTDVAAFCCTCSCHLQLTMPPTTSSLHHHSFCCFCELTYSHRKWKREFEESGLPGFGYESCSHESCSKQDMHQSWSKLIKACGMLPSDHRIFRELRAQPSCSASTAWSTNPNPIQTSNGLHAARRCTVNENTTIRASRRRNCDMR